MEDEDARHDRERRNQVEVITHFDVPGGIEKKVERLLKRNTRPDDQSNRERCIVRRNQTHNSLS